MNIILQEMKAYLRSELRQDIDQKLTIDKPCRVVSVRPPNWILENYNARYFPGVFIWGVGEEIKAGHAVDTFDARYQVQIQIFMQSTKKALSALSPSFGVYGLTKKILNLLSDNKKLDKLTGNKVVTGLELPFTVRDSQIQIEDKLSAIGRTIAFTYVRERNPWHWKQKNETRDGTASMFDKFNFS